MEALITGLFSEYAYSPWLVYGAIWVFMILSAFGLPIPEEVILVSSGFVGFMALNPSDYPPPSPDATPVNVYVLATVALTAVMASDYLIYFLGKRFGPRLFRMKWFSRLVNAESLEKIQSWSSRYGYWTVFFFRFTPGIRFPGHLMCGAMGVPRSRFLAIDAVAAGISVPTQVLLVAFYGEYILKSFAQFKLYFFSALAIFVVGFLIYRRIRKTPTELMVEVPSESTVSETKRAE